MAVESQADLLLALGRGDFGLVIGTQESEEVEFKSSPYRLEERRQRWELAKDVAALANQRGGSVIFGFRTQRAENQLVDTAIEHRPVAKNLIDWDAYRQTIATWVRPAIEGLTAHWFRQTPRKKGASWSCPYPPSPTTRSTSWSVR